MPPNFQEPTHTAGHADISSRQTTTQFPETMVQSSQSCKIIKAVMSSKAEAEIGALYINCKEAIPARHTLEYLGHKQPPTPMQTDNTTAPGVVNNKVMKKLKAMDMKYHWLRCRINQHQFRHYWAAGKSNNGNYITKHHALIHHQATRSTFLTPITILQTYKTESKVYSP
jgi:hypothetical protein